MDSSTGLPAKVAMFIAYLFWWISGLAIFLIEKQNRDVRFHAAQSIVLFGSLSVLNLLLPLVPAIGPVVASLLGPINVIAWLVLLAMVATDRAPRIPVLCNFADQLVASPYESKPEEEPSQDVTPPRERD